jgi:excinuclease ABC subunit C
LRNRVRSYFQDGSPDPKKAALVSKIADVEIIVTDSELEALLLENNLIKEHSPRYNVRLKDDKSYPYIVVTNEAYPRVFPTRRMIRDGSHYHGPYSDVRAMHLMLKTLRSIFPIRSCDLDITADSIERGRFKVCLDYHIRKCEGPCEGLVSQAAYSEMIAQVEKLLKGRTREIRQSLEAGMRQCAEQLEFEKAAELRNRLMALQKHQERQKVVATDGADRDIFAVAQSGAEAVGVVFRIRDGNIIGRRHYLFSRAGFEDDAEMLRHLLEYHYTQTQDIPPEALLPVELEDSASMESYLSSITGTAMTLVFPKIGEKAKLLRMTQANATFILDDILLQRMKADTALPGSVQALQRDLRLSNPPRRIECFDISHFQGDETVASMVSFLDGKPRKSEYRKYMIKTVEGVDDFASMREVVSRRYRRVLDEGLALPDLVVIDGGKGQLSSALEVLRGLDLATLPVIGLAKRLEEVFVPGDSAPLSIPKTSSGLRLLQRIRDEAHRFAITFHRTRRDAATLQTELEQIDGIGPKRAHDLLEKLGSVRAVQSAQVEELAELVGWSAARKITAYFEGAADEDQTETNEEKDI